MIHQMSHRMMVAASAVMLLVACGGAAEQSAPAGEAPPEIAERQDNFEGIGDSFKAVRAQLEGDNPDYAAVAAAAGDVNERAQKITGLFPDGSSIEAGYDTEALAAIWEKPDEFERAANNLVEASAGLRTAAQEGNLKAVANAVKIMGATCKGCHDKFRVDED